MSVEEDQIALQFAASSSPVVAYWRCLHLQLKEALPELYKLVFCDTTVPLILTREQFFVASMILNNVKLIPKVHPISGICMLPPPSLSRAYEAYFEQAWEQHAPNIVIGCPEIKTCANHRMEVLSQYDFVCWRGNPGDVPTLLPIYATASDEDLREFFRALALFQRTAGVNAVNVYDFVLENKIIRIARRYVASKEEYESYWNQNAKLNQQLLSSRKTHCRCFWCYQSFLGLTCQGMSKGLLYDRVDHIPKAMRELVCAMPLLNVPLYYICKTIIEYLGRPSMEDALPAYNRAVDAILAQMCDEDPDLKDCSAATFSDKFESKLQQFDRYLLESAAQAFQDDFVLMNNVPPGFDPSSAIVTRESTQLPLFVVPQDQPSVSLGSTPSFDVGSCPPSMTSSQPLQDTLPGPIDEQPVSSSYGSSSSVSQEACSHSEDQCCNTIRPSTDSSSSPMPETADASASVVAAVPSQGSLLPTLNQSSPFVEEGKHSTALTNTSAWFRSSALLLFKTSDQVSTVSSRSTNQSTVSSAGDPMDHPASEADSDGRKSATGGAKSNRRRRKSGHRKNLYRPKKNNSGGSATVSASSTAVHRSATLSGV